MTQAVYQIVFGLCERVGGPFSLRQKPKPFDGIDTNALSESQHIVSLHGPLTWETQISGTPMVGVLGVPRICVSRSVLRRNKFPI